MSDTVARNYHCTFDGNPTILQISQQMNYATRLFREYAEVDIEVDGDGQVHFDIYESQ